MNALNSWVIGKLHPAFNASHVARTKPEQSRPNPSKPEEKDEPPNEQKSELSRCYLPSTLSNGQ